MMGGKAARSWVSRVNVAPLLQILENPAAMPHRHAVLLVDDHLDGLAAMQSLIEAHDFEVVGTSTAEEALMRLRDGLPCCLVIFDWRMPGMNGEQFYRALSAEPRLCELPLLVVSGDVRAVNRARALGIRHAELKPIEPSTLLGIIGEHCTRSGAA